MKNKKAWAEYQREYNKRNKIDAINHYGGKCNRCGHEKIKSLTIDHINGKGAEHRRQMKLSGPMFYGWLKKKNYPKEFQCLCMNCQFIKREENKEYANR